MEFDRNRYRWLWLVLAIATFVSGCSTTQSLPDWMSFSRYNHDDKLVQWETSYESALSLAQSTGKPLMLWFTGSDWCTWCVRLEEEVFQTAEFQTWSEENVVPMILDFPKSQSIPPEIREQNDQLRTRYESFIDGFPKVLLVDSSGQVIGKLGYVRGGPANWIRAAEAAMSGTANP